MTEKKLIYLVDPDVPASLELKGLLEKEGYRVRFFSDSVKALHHARRERFDLLVTDLQLPKVSGFELSYYVLNENPDISIIFRTDFYDISALARSFKHIVSSVLAKSVPLLNLVGNINTLFGHEIVFNAGTGNIGSKDKAFPEEAAA